MTVDTRSGLRMLTLKWDFWMASLTGRLAMRTPSPLANLEESRFLWGGQGIGVEKRGYEKSHGVIN